jgi:hypothetical protein
LFSHICIHCSYWHEPGCLLSPSLNLSNHFPFSQFHIPPMMVNMAVLKRAIFPTFPLHHSCCLRPGSACLVNMSNDLPCCWDIFITACEPYTLQPWRQLLPLKR